MALLTYIERFISWLFINNRGIDDLTFTRTPAFANLPSPTITVTSPDGGANNCVLKLEHTQDGEDWHPILEWTLPEGLTADVTATQGEEKTRVYEYLVICEDADLPLPRRFAKVSKLLPARCLGLRLVSRAYRYLARFRLSLGPKPVSSWKGMKKKEEEEKEVETKNVDREAHTHADS